LCLALVVGVAALVTHSGAKGSDATAKAEQAAQALAKQHLPQAMAVVQRLQVPADFEPIKLGCRWYRCYVVPETTSQAAPLFPVIMSKLGADNPQSRRLRAAMQGLSSPMSQYANSLLQRLGVRSRALGISGCEAVYSRTHGAIVHCAEPAVIDDNVITVFLEPYLPCQNRACRWTNKTEVDIAYPSGAPQSASE
jgi:hypothetical protein